MSVFFPFAFPGVPLTSCKVTNPRDDKVFVEFFNVAGDSILGHTRVVVGKVNRGWPIVLDT